MKVVVEFPVFDIGTKSTCNYNYNVVFIYDVTTDGEAVLSNTYCGGVKSMSKYTINYLISFSIEST